MQAQALYFFGLILSALSLTVLLAYIFFLKNKKRIHYLLCGMLFSAFLTTLFAALNFFVVKRTGTASYYLAAAAYIGLCGIPVLLFFTSLEYTDTKIEPKPLKYLIAAIPAVSVVMIWTNQYHHLFYISYSPLIREAVMGVYAYFHLFYFYFLIMLSLFHLLRFSSRSSGIFSGQSILIIVSAAFPFIVNIIYSSKIVKFSYSVTPLFFTFSVLCFAVAILKFRFLNVMPIALQRVVNLISDSYAVINDKFDLIDFNKKIIDTFQAGTFVKKSDNLIEFINRNHRFNINTEFFIAAVRNAQKYRKTISFEKKLKIGESIRYFAVELTPVFSENSFLGTIILLKELTQVQKDLNTIKKIQKEMLIKERLSELGRLIESIAQSFEAPITGISEDVRRIKELTAEYRKSLEIKKLPVDEHKKLSLEIRETAAEIAAKCGEMTQILNSVKAHTILTDSEEADNLKKRLNNDGSD